MPAKTESRLLNNTQFLRLHLTFFKRTKKLISVNDFFENLTMVVQNS